MKKKIYHVEFFPVNSPLQEGAAYHFRFGLGEIAKEMNTITQKAELRFLPNRRYVCPAPVSTPVDDNVRMAGPFLVADDVRDGQLVYYYDSTERESGFYDMPTIPPSSVATTEVTISNVFRTHTVKLFQLSGIVGPIEPSSPGIDRQRRLGGDEWVWSSQLFSELRADSIVLSCPCCRRFPNSI
jgi:hypothetical protein